MQTAGTDFGAAADRIPRRIRPFDFGFVAHSSRRAQLPQQTKSARLTAMAKPSILAELPKYTREAVRFYWQTRSQQLEKQRKAGGSDQGLRSAVTGGAQMNGFIELLTKLVVEAGLDRSHIYYQNSLELPGYFRPNKKWDFIVVGNGQLVAALEAKSQVGPSFGNNFKRRTEETICSALDLWAAFRKQGTAVRPWVGYLLFVEDRVAEDDVGTKSPFLQHCESLCRRLFLERYYDNVAFVVSDATVARDGGCREPASDFTFRALANSLFGHAVTTSRCVEQLSALAHSGRALGPSETVCPSS